MTFRIGQKVVCIADRRGRVNDLGLPGFVKGHVYTITSFYEEPPHGLFLSTAELGPRVGGQVCGFRPIVERKTDIGFAHEILRKASKKIPATLVPSAHRGIE
jgi:hypothetical protein